MLQEEFMKVKVGSPDGDIDFFDIVVSVLQGNTLAPYLFIICLDYVLRTLKKARSRQFPTQTIIKRDCTNDILLLANTPTHA